MRNCLNYRVTKRVSRTGLPVLLKRNQSCRGQALVEFTLVAMFFFLLAFATIDFSWLLFNQMDMQDAVREAARCASTGYHIAELQSATDLPLAHCHGRSDSEPVPGGIDMQTVTISSVGAGLEALGGPATP